MKHLLILLISILLLSSPVIGQETGVLYQYKTSSGIKWKTFGNEKVQQKYKGEITNGKPNGFGFQTYKNGNKYFGEHKNGLPNGQGKSIYPDGSMYLGEYKDGKPWNVKGYDKEGNIIEKWVNGKIIKQ